MRTSTRTGLILSFVMVALHVAAACRIDGHYVPFDAEPEIDAELPIGDWATRYGGLGDDIGAAAAVAPNGDLVLAGSFMDIITLGGPALSSDGGADVWVARYKANGTFVWSTRFGGIGTDRGSGVAVDQDGDVYVVGDFVGPVDFGGGVRANDGGFLVKLAAETGRYVWDRTFEASGAEDVSAVATLDASTVVVGGRFSGTANLGGGALVSTPSNSRDGFVAAYSMATGGHVWSKVLTTSGEDDIFGGLTVVGGDVIVAGAFKGTGTLGGSPLQSTGDYDIFVARYRGADGGHVWSMRRGGGGVQQAVAIATDGTHVLVGGSFVGMTNLGGLDLSGTGFRCAFIALYDASDGAHVWSHAFSASYRAYVASLAASPTRLVVSIVFDGDFTIGTQMFTGSSAEAVVRLNTSSGEPRVAIPFENASLYGRPSLTYAADRLVGAGTFHTTTELFGVDLTSAGGADIAVFHVDF